MVVRCFECEHINPSDAVHCEKCGTSIVYRQSQPHVPAKESTGIGTGIKIGIGFCIGVLVFLGACAACLVSITDRNSRNISAPGISTRQQSKGVTLAQYNQLREGMTYQEVIKILGKDGTGISSSTLVGTRTDMFTWEGSGAIGANMNVMFQNGKLVSKAQFGLQ